MTMIRKIIQLGWKNVWRSPTRSFVVISAVLLGIWAGVFISAFFNGMAQGYLQNQLNLAVGHIQITNPEFEDQLNPKYGISNAGQLYERLEQIPYITTIRAESMSSGLAQSAANSFGVTIHGVTSDSDSAHPIIPYIEQGDMLRSVSRNPVVIGVELAERLELDLRSKLVLSFQDVNGEITAGAFRVAGIFDASNKNFNRANVFVERSDLNRLLGQENLIHKITLKVDDFTRSGAHAIELQERFPSQKIAGWGELAPELQYVYDSMDISLYVIMIIIIIALVFSIVNTMLMAILERTRELGMLMAVGMNQARLFLMILAETVFLTMAGTPLGLLLSWATVSYFGTAGIDLGPFAEGLAAYGMATVIYPELTVAYYVNITLFIVAAALISSLYPSWKTMKLKPVEAIRKI